jgi:hypothetical protein
MRFDSEFARCSAVWPFETGWAPPSGTWLDRETRIVHAEIYPSVRAPLRDTIKDRGQVRAMWHWARDFDAKNLLNKEFAIPPGITSGSGEDHTIRREEGWILGCPLLAVRNALPNREVDRTLPRFRFPKRRSPP